MTISTRRWMIFRSTAEWIGGYCSIRTRFCGWRRVIRACRGRRSIWRATPPNALWLSVASIWEIAIKSSLGKLELSTKVEVFVEDQTKAMALKILDVQARHAMAVARLPFHHRDPFDRLLLAQARTENLELLSRDQRFDDCFGGRDLVRRPSRGITRRRRRAWRSPP